MTVIQPLESLTLADIPMDAIRTTIRDIPDFPKPGILFKDVTTVLREPHLFQGVIDYFALQVKDMAVDYVVGIESRGFILGAPLACRLGVGFVPIRKKGKLPGPVDRLEYTLEYGSDCVEIHRNAIPPKSRVLVVDDLIATGGTAGAAALLLESLQSEWLGMLFMIELTGLGGREKLPHHLDLYNAMLRFE